MKQTSEWMALVLILFMACSPGKENKSPDATPGSLSEAAMPE